MPGTKVMAVNLWNFQCKIAKTYLPKMINTELNVVTSEINMTK